MNSEIFQSNDGLDCGIHSRAHLAELKLERAAYTNGFRHKQLIRGFIVRKMFVILGKFRHLCYR